MRIGTASWMLWNLALHEASAGLATTKFLSRDEISILDALVTEDEEKGPLPTFEEESICFGRYEILHLLGRGSMGIVYAARDLLQGGRVALKVLREGADAQARVLFRREASFLARLRHPHIVPLLDRSLGEGPPYFSMALVEGPTLEEPGLPRPESVAILCSIAEAVEYVHRVGALHLDLKPRNVLIDPQGSGYLIDFGLIRPMGNDPTGISAGTIIGTPAYMSPEQLEGDAGKLDRRTDVWGLGAILYHVFTGRAPFPSAMTWSALAEARERGPIPPREIDSTIPRPLEAICLRALEKKPERRFRSAAEFAAALRERNSVSVHRGTRGP